MSGTTETPMERRERTISKWLASKLEDWGGVPEDQMRPLAQLWYDATSAGRAGHWIGSCLHLADCTKWIDVYNHTNTCLRCATKLAIHKQNE